MFGAASRVLSRLNVKIIIVLIYALALLLFELFSPASFLISIPLAQLVHLTIHSLGIASSRTGASIWIGEAKIDFTDLCTGIPATILVALFMWIGSFSARAALGTASLLILFNVLRSIAVAYLLSTYGYPAAALAHNLSYLLLTVITIAVMWVSVSRVLPRRWFKRRLSNALGCKTMKMLRHLRNRRAISPLIATVLLLGIAIVASIGVAGWVFGWFRGTGGAVLEGIQSRVYFDPATGKGKIHLRIANTGTGSAQIRAINITGEQSINIVFDTSGSPYVPKPEAPEGKTWTLNTHYRVALVGSVPTVAITDDDSVGTDLGALNLPANSWADIVLKWTSTTAENNLAGMLTLGATYRGTIWPKTGTGASPTDFTVRIESYIP